MLLKLPKISSSNSGLSKGQCAIVDHIKNGISKYPPPPQLGKATDATGCLTGGSTFGSGREEGECWTGVNDVGGGGVCETKCNCGVHNRRTKRDPGCPHTPPLGTKQNRAPRVSWRAQSHRDGGTGGDGWLNPGRRGHCGANAEKHQRLQCIL
jgi:hypothetical protein